jgi:hypothetical protein
MILIPSSIFTTWGCDFYSPALYLIYVLHNAQNLFYCSKMYSLLKMRLRELAKLKEHKYELQWSEPLDAEELKKIGVSSFENFKA